MIPVQFIPAIEKGVREQLEKGVVSGNPVVDVEVEVFFGSHHAVDSSEQAFKTAGAAAFRKAFIASTPGRSCWSRSSDLDDHRPSRRSSAPSRPTSPPAAATSLGMESVPGGLQTHASGGPAQPKSFATPPTSRA